MSTSFTLSLGYFSGYIGESDKEKQWELLKNLVKHHTLPHNVLQIVFGKEDVAEYFEDIDYTPEEFYKGYIESGMYVYEEDRRISFTASGGNPARAIKEIFAFATCLCVIRSAFMLGFYVNIDVS